MCPIAKTCRSQNPPPGVYDHPPPLPSRGKRCCLLRCPLPTHPINEKIRFSFVSRALARSKGDAWTGGNTRATCWDPSTWCLWVVPHPHAPQQHRPLESFFLGSPLHAPWCPAESTPEHAHSSEGCRLEQAGTYSQDISEAFPLPVASSETEAFALSL